MLGLLTKVDERSLRRHFIWSAEHMDVAQALLPRLMLGSPHRALHRCEQVNRVLHAFGHAYSPWSDDAASFRAGVSKCTIKR